MIMQPIYFNAPVRYAGLNDTGKTRSENQDRLLLCPEAGLFGVSDGMGGLPRGTLAADYTVQALPLLLESVQPSTVAEAEETLKAAVSSISDKLFEKTNKQRFMTGATVCAVWLVQNSAVCVNLGDSRAYLLRKWHRRLIPLTEDMNLAGILVQMGEMTKEEAASSPAASQLSAFSGMTAPATPEVTVQSLDPGDRLLLCSDGLYGLVPEKEMVRILRSSRNPDIVCRRLISRANEYGGRDNISAVYLRVG